MPFGLEESDVNAIHDILSSYPQVTKSILYGSRAKGNYRVGSDIDLVLYGGKDLDLNILYGIMEDIDNLLLPYTFDLSIFSKISDPDVVAHILRAGIVFYEK